MRDLEHSPGWNAANRALWFLGTAVVAAQGVALLIYGSGIQAAADEAARQQVMTEHVVICEKLDKRQGDPGREQCLNLLRQLQQRHEQAYMARTTGPF